MPELTKHQQRYRRDRERILARQQARRDANRGVEREKEQARARRRWADPVEHEKRRARNWRRLYGADATFVTAIFYLQKERCAVCGARLEWGKHLHIDHCHETKTVRGILCRACNQAEGHIKDSGLSPEEFAKRLADYLANPPADTARLV